MIATLILMTGLTSVPVVAGATSSTNHTNNPAAAIPLKTQPAAGKLSARLAALGMIETGNIDNPHTEDLSRYGISRPVWREYTDLPYTAATNPIIAGTMVASIMHDRVWRFAAKVGRQPNDVEWYCLWHRPAYATRMRPKDIEIGRRFENLARVYGSNESSQASPH